MSELLFLLFSSGSENSNFTFFGYVSKSLFLLSVGSVKNEVVKTYVNDDKKTIVLGVQGRVTDDGLVRGVLARCKFNTPVS